MKGDKAKEIATIVVPPGFRFRSLGKVFRKKPEAPAHSAPPLRISTILHIDSKTYPILQDDVFELYREEPKLIVRLGSYRHNSVEIQCYRLVPVSFPSRKDLHFYDKVWELIVKARRADSAGVW